MWRHFDFHARLTKQNFSFETTEANNHVKKKKKKTITRRVPGKLTIQILSLPNRFTHWDQTSPPFFP